MVVVDNGKQTMAATKIISFRVEEDVADALKGFSQEGESVNDTARRLLLGVIGGSLEPKASKVEQQLSELWTVVNELRGKSVA
jgi:hypothetical protein